jgi:hypothetical protein
MRDVQAGVSPRQPMVAPELWQNMLLLPPEDRPKLVWPGDHFTAALLADPGLVAACVRNGRHRA